MSKAKLPEDIAESVRRALAEDVGAGDLTAALIPAGRRPRRRLSRASRPSFAARPGSTRFSARWTSASASPGMPATAMPSSAGQMLCTLRGPGTRTPHRRARRAQFPAIALRHRDAGAEIRGRRARHARDHPRHAQDHSRTAPCPEIRGRLRRRAESPHGFVRRHPDQGKPYRRGGLDRRGAERGQSLRADET